MKTYEQNPSKRWVFACERGKSGYERCHSPLVSGLAQLTLKPPALALQSVAFPLCHHVCFTRLRQLAFEIGDPLVCLGFLLRDGVQSGILRTPRSRPLRGRSSTWGIFQSGFQLGRPILGVRATLFGAFPADGGKPLRWPYVE